MWFYTASYHVFGPSVLTEALLPTLVVFIALDQATTKEHVAIGSPYNAGTVLNGTTIETLS